MGAILRPKKNNTSSSIIPEKSIHISNSRIDRAGNAWERKAIWLRQDYVGKLKVVAHFQNKPLDQLVDEALTDYLKIHWDSTTARRSLVGKSTNKPQPVKI